MPPPPPPSPPSAAPLARALREAAVAREVHRRAGTLGPYSMNVGSQVGITSQLCHGRAGGPSAAAALGGGGSKLGELAAPARL